MNTKPASAPVAPQAPSAPVVPGTITVLVANNPKQEGSASRARFALYKPGMTVEAYKSAVKALGQPYSLAAADLRWDVRHKFISIAK